DIALLIAHLDAALDAVEERRSQRHETVGGEAVGELLDVRVDPEDLLDDDEAAAGLALGRGLVGSELESIIGREVDHLSHRGVSFSSDQRGTSVARPRAESTVNVKRSSTSRPRRPSMSARPMSCTTTVNGPTRVPATSSSGTVTSRAVADPVTPRMFTTRALPVSSPVRAKAAGQMTVRAAPVS